MSSHYSGDPRWITAKYAGVDAKGLPFKAGETVFYFPKGKRIYSGANATEASSRFESGHIGWTQHIDAERLIDK